MLDKNSKQLLNKLISDMPDLPFNAFSFDYFNEYNLNNCEVSSQIEYLISNGYLEKCMRNGKWVGYNLTHEGRHYKEIQRLENIDFFKKSILVPIAVSILTTLITAFISHIF